MDQKIIYLLLLYSSLTLNVQCVLHSLYEEFNNKQISLSNINWNCNGLSTKPTKVLKCNKGMEQLVLESKLNQCHNIQKTIQAKQPHFEIQLYIDIQGNRSIDPNECINIQITNQSNPLQKCLDPVSQKLFGKSLNCDPDNDYNYQLRQTHIIQIASSSEDNMIQIQLKYQIQVSYANTNYQIILQINLIVWSNTDDEYESYSFRNIQLFLNRCYKTCKTCSGEGENQCDSCYDGINLSNHTCKSCKDKQNEQFLQIPDGCRNNCVGNNGFDEDFVCKEDISVQQSCQENCQLCTNTQYCLSCKEKIQLHSGQCITRCPKYTKVEGQFCLNSIDLLRKYNLRIIEQVKEFYDLSSTDNKIKKLFQFKSSGSVIKNFLKGDQIYFSYLSNKRIFGGPFVWINAKFQFTYQLTQTFEYFRIVFEVILGDEQLSQNKLNYQINSEQQKTITLDSTAEQQNDYNFEDSNWPSNYIYNLYQVDVSLSQKQSTNQQIIIDLECLGSNTLSFCAIQNFVIVGFSECETGYKFDLFNYESKINPCIPICGDKIIIGNEECDDGNEDPFDGCFNCRHHCQEFCLNCVRGQCLKMISIKIQELNKFEMDIDYDQSYDLDIASFSCMFQCNFCVNNLCMQCNYGYYLNPYTNLCMTTCGDSIQQYYEQCDDGNIDDYDGCSNCQLIQYEKCDKDPEIIKHHCSVCYLGKCLKCKDGFLLAGDICNSVCGDGLINIQEEECDTEQEGCNKCKIQSGYICGKLPYSTCSTCDKECKNCSSPDKINLICLSCIDGYYAKEDKCYKCDSNCIECNIQSHLCTSCFREDCDFCESTPGLFADLKIRQCNSICGDGIQVESYEQCDDHNLKNGDGCDSQCNLEYSDDELNRFKNYQFQGNNTYDLQINSSSKLKLLCNTSNINIENIDIQYYNYNITQINLLTCRLQFEFKKSVYEFNIIHVKLNYISANQIYRQLLDQVKITEYNIPPNKAIYLDEDEITQKQYIQSAQEQFYFYFLIIIPVSIFLNLFDCLWAVLDILSWINNFYFLNVNYPFNVEEFFLKSDWSSFVSIPTYQGLNQPDSNYYFEAPKRFKDKGINPLFFNNIQIPFIFIAFSFLLYSINYILFQFFSSLNDSFKKKFIIKAKHFSIFNIQITQKKQKKLNKDSPKVQIKSNPYLKVITDAFKQNQIRLINQIKQTIQLCLLDITLAIILQLSLSNDPLNLIVGVNQFFAIITIAILSIKHSQTQSLNKNFEELYGVYYENINIEKQFGYYYLFFEQISKILYIFFMVNYYYNPLLQTSLCYSTSSLRFFLLLYDNPYNSKMQFIIELISNFCLSSIIFIILLFSMNDETTKQFIVQYKVILGWLIISLVILAILVEFCVLVAGIFVYFFDIYKMIKNFTLKIINKKKDKKQQQQLKQPEASQQIKIKLEVLADKANVE